MSVVEVPEDRIIYTCSSGRHELASRHPLTKCPGYWLGSPCKGTLTRVGKGSRPKKEKAA